MRVSAKRTSSACLFGEEPNAFLKSQAPRLRPGWSALAVADGEGRNGVWLAEQGLAVTSIEASPVALAKARALAMRRGVTITTVEADLSTWTWPEQAFDCGAANFRFMSAHQTMFPIKTMARVFKVSASGYYAWRGRPASERATADLDLMRRIRTIHAASRGTYGAPRVHAEFKAEGVAIGKKRVARLMQAAGLAGAGRRRSVATTRRDPDHRPANDLVRRNFFAGKPNELWVADITLVPTLAGFLFLAVVMDAWSRRIVGWAFSADLKTRVVLDALDMALAVRKPESVIHHSDQGSQYTSLAFGHRCKDAGVRPSTGSVGGAYDNAMCESFFATREYELLDRHRFRSHSEARMAVFRFIEGFYNPSRRHSALGFSRRSNTKGSFMS